MGIYVIVGLNHTALNHVKPAETENPLEESELKNMICATTKNWNKGEFYDTG